MTENQINEIKHKRLSGKYTLAELGNEYGITRERIRQIVGIKGLKKAVEKVCITCGNKFLIHGLDRDKCSVLCREPIKEQTCVDCNNKFMPLSKNNLLRCQKCYSPYRLERLREYAKQHRASKKKLSNN